MFKPLMYYTKAIAAVWEVNFPTPDKISWLEKQELREHHSRGARIATPEKDADLLALVGEVYAADKKKTPKVIIYQSPKPNAIHCNNNTLLISQAKLDQNDPIALKATLAHEEDHDLQNNLSLALIFARGLAILAATTAITNKLTPALNKTKAAASLAVTATFAATATLLHYATEPLWAMYRRWQEKDADKHSVKVTGSAEGMIRNFEHHEAHKKAVTVEEPKGAEKIWKDLTRSHPDHETRIAAMKKAEAELQRQV